MKEAPTRAEGAPGYKRASGRVFENSENSSQGIASLRALVKSCGGELYNGYALLPGPGHGPKDRSLKVWLSGDRIYVHSFAGDDWQDCRAFLGLDDQHDWRRERRDDDRVHRRPPTTATPTRRVRDLIRKRRRSLFERLKYGGKAKPNLSEGSEPEKFGIGRYARK